MQLVLLPPDGGQVSRPRRRKPCLSLTDAENTRLIATLRGLRRAYGTWRCVAEVMGVSVGALKKIAHRQGKGGPATVLRAARAANLTVEQVLSGKLGVVGRCATCGRGSE